MFAIIETGGKQYKVTKGLHLEVEKLEGAEGKEFTFDKVLFVNNGADNQFGAPYIQGAKVSAKIVGHTRGDKIRVYKMKAKKRYQKTRGHRQSLTKLEITEIK